jgi:hypothetical protein
VMLFEPGTDTAFFGGRVSGAISRRGG